MSNLQPSLELIQLVGGLTKKEEAAVRAAVPRYVAVNRFLNRVDVARQGSTKKTCPQPTADAVLAQHGISLRYRRNKLRYKDIVAVVIQQGEAQLDKTRPPTHKGRSLGSTFDLQVAELASKGTPSKLIASLLDVSVVTVYRSLRGCRDGGEAEARL